MFKERTGKVIPNMMDENDFYRGISASTLSINKKPYLYVSGFLGVEFETTVPDKKHPDEILQAVKPAIGWAVYEDDPSLKAEKRVFLAADTAGPIFGK